MEVSKKWLPVVTPFLRLSMANPSELSGLIANASHKAAPILVKHIMLQCPRQPALFLWTRNGPEVNAHGGRVLSAICSTSKGKVHFVVAVSFNSARQLDVASFFIPIDLAGTTRTNYEKGRQY